MAAAEAGRTMEMKVSMRDWRVKKMRMGMHRRIEDNSQTRGRGVLRLAGLVLHMSAQL